MCKIVKKNICFMLVLDILYVWANFGFKKIRCFGVESDLR